MAFRRRLPKCAYPEFCCPQHGEDGMASAVEMIESPELVQILRRLGLVEGADDVPDLEQHFDRAVLATLLPPAGARQVVRAWQDFVPRHDSGDPGARYLPVSFYLIALHRIRTQPAAVADLLAAPVDTQTTLARCSLDTARSLHRYSRNQFGASNTDAAVNAALEAQREFLFSAGSGRLTDEQMRDALGKYAVAVALTARWTGPSEQVLRRAHRYMVQSIDFGNDGPEAHGYLVELLGAMYAATSNLTLLDDAIEIAGIHGLTLLEAEAEMRRGLALAEMGQSAIGSLQRAASLADAARTRTAGEAVQRLLVKDFAFAAILGSRPLPSTKASMPAGLLQMLAAMDSPSLDRAAELTELALSPDRELGSRRARRRTVPELRVLLAVLREQLRRGGDDANATAARLIEVASELRLQGSHRLGAELEYVEALLERASATRSPDDLDEALAVCAGLRSTSASSPMVKVAWARGLSLRDDIGGPVSGDETRTAWSDAVGSVVAHAEFRRTDLGGRSGVFAIDDARGELSNTFVFKPMITEHPAVQEQKQLTALEAELAVRGEERRFAVPRSLGVFSDGAGGFVHVLERQVGVVLSTLPSSEISDHLAECVDLLGIFHSIDSNREVQDGWRNLRRMMSPWVRSLLPLDIDEFMTCMRSALPMDLPMVRKRDAHLGNWVIDRAGIVVAIDLDSPKSLPVGHDLAQLLEDGATVPVQAEAMDRRYSLFRRYIEVARLARGTTELEATYDWFALFRAIWLGTYQSATKAQHSHARQLVAHIASKWQGASLGDAADMVSAPMRAGVASADLGVLSAQQRRLSKAMARALRHSATDLGLAPDDAGFVSIEALADAIRQPFQAIASVASHPAEPRFQIDDGRIRALYGHSFPVADLNEISTETPAHLFHGTSWDFIDGILSDGLRPQLRQYVHLTNNAGEAIEVARRHGHPLLLKVDTSSLDALRATDEGVGDSPAEVLLDARPVADAVWAASDVPPELLRIANAFVEVRPIPEWLEATVQDSP